jgi:Bacteriophage head to tail connecting protein
MAENTTKQLINTRLGQLKSDRASWFAHWQEITTYLLPRNGRYFIQDHNKGWKRHNNIYDNTGTKALRTLAAGLMGGLTSPARPWFRLATQDPDMMKSADVKQWLADCTRIMLDIFQRSNTYRALHGSYEELGAFGTSGTILTADFHKVIHHHPLTIGEYCYASNWKGEVCTMMREFEKTVGEIVKEFGIDKVSPTVKRMYDNGNLDAWIPIIHAIEPNEDRDPTKLDSGNMAWTSTYYERGSSLDTPLRVGGFKQFPVLAPRWQVAGGDIYGNSPGMESLGDIKQLQQEQLRKSQAIDYMTMPPLQVPSSLKNREIERLPGGITYYDNSTASEGIKTMFDVRLDLSHLLADTQDVRERIRGSFYADMFLMLSNDQDTRKTATEVAELHEEKMLMIGPVLERLQNELLDPLIEFTFTQMIQHNLVPPAPPELQGQQINVELVSMLAQAQRAIATNGVDRFVNNLGMIAQFKPDVVDNFDADQWASRYSDMLGVDPELIVANDKVALVRQQRQQAQQQAQQAAVAQQAADSAQKLGNTPTQGGQSTALDDATSGFSGYN